VGPISNTNSVLDWDSEVFVGNEGVCTMIVVEAVPTVVDKLNRFENVVDREILRDVVSSVVSTPVDCAFYVCREIIGCSMGDGGGVIWIKGYL
jgi:hypothetical protein